MSELDFVIDKNRKYLNDLLDNVNELLEHEFELSEETVRNLEIEKIKIEAKLSVWHTVENLLEDSKYDLNSLTINYKNKERVTYSHDTYESITMSTSNNLLIYNDEGFLIDNRCINDVVTIEIGGKEIKFIDD